MATDDRDTPAGAAGGTRADMPAGASATHADHGNPGADSGSPDYAEAAAEPFPPADARPGAGPAVPEGLGPGTPGAGNDASAGPAPVEQADERPDDDFEPFLPPGPNPFSSVHPQGTPPYRRRPTEVTRANPASLRRRPASGLRIPVVWSRVLRLRVQARTPAGSQRTSGSRGRPATRSTATRPCRPIRPFRTSLTSPVPPMVAFRPIPFTGLTALGRTTAPGMR